MSYAQRGDDRKAETYLREAITASQKETKENLRRAKLLNALAQVVDPDQGEEYIREAMRIREGSRRKPRDCR